MMSEPLTLVTLLTLLTPLYPLALAGLAGTLLGGIFFGTLWWSIHKSLTARHTATWLLSCLLLRMALTVAGFYFVAGGQWQRLLACLCGFVVSRMLVLRCKWSRPPPPREISHAP
jgi:F1F0 ATPase subunit 2